MNLKARATCPASLEAERQVGGEGVLNEPGGRRGWGSTGWSSDWPQEEWTVEYGAAWMICPRRKPAWGHRCGGTDHTYSFRCPKCTLSSSSWSGEGCQAGATCWHSSPQVSRESVFVRLTSRDKKWRREKHWAQNPRDADNYKRKERSLGWRRDRTIRNESLTEVKGGHRGEQEGMATNVSRCRRNWETSVEPGLWGRTGGFGRGFLGMGMGKPRGCGLKSQRRIECGHQEGHLWRVKDSLPSFVFEILESVYW